MARRYDKEDSRQRILSACVQLFIEQGYHNTTPKQILSAADVASGTFYYIFKAKSGVLVDLTDFIFDRQFENARRILGEEADPILLYTVETAIQLTLVELNENLREIYVEAYSQPEVLTLIHERTAVELKQIFSAYLPECSESDFYELEIGTSGIMRGFMARQCDMYFTLDKKLSRFLRMTFDVFSVPKKVQQKALEYLAGLDIRKIAGDVTQRMFAALEEKFSFTLSE